MHLSSVIPANDTRESVFGLQNFPSCEQGSNLGPPAPEASVLTTELPLLSRLEIVHRRRKTQGHHCMSGIYNKGNCVMPCSLNSTILKHTCNGWGMSGSIYNMPIFIVVTESTGQTKWRSVKQQLNL